jgi:AcrR family transcriptional regulator
MVVQSDALLETATRVLLADPSASLGDVARAAGMSRTSLHTRYPTRTALLTALAHEAMDLVEQVYEASDLGADDPLPDVLERLVTGLVPLGPRVEFLMRERSLDAVPAVVARYEALDAPLTGLVERRQAAGELDPALPAWWVTAALNGTVYTAWEAIADGRLAPRDAPALVLATVLRGVGR